MMNLEFRSSVVRVRIRLRPCERGDKLKPGLVGTIITITITKTQLKKHSEKVTGSLSLGRIIDTEIEHSCFSVRENSLTLVRKVILQVKVSG